MTRSLGSFPVFFIYKELSLWQNANVSSAMSKKSSKAIDSTYFRGWPIPVVTSRFSRPTFESALFTRKYLKVYVLRTTLLYIGNCWN